MPGPRLPRHRLGAGLALIAAGRVPGSPPRSASAVELSRFARAVLAPVAASRCEWCSGGGCPACGADTGRERYALVLRAVQEDGPISGREVRRRLGGAPGLIVRALTALEREGLVAREGSGRMTTWRARSLEDES